MVFCLAMVFVDCGIFVSVSEISPSSATVSKLYASQAKEEQGAGGQSYQFPNA